MATKWEGTLNSRIPFEITEVMLLATTPFNQIYKTFSLAQKK
jgi:hypothetical protein